MAAPLALIRRPGPLLDQGLVTNIERVPVDMALALDQWERYVAAFAASGWDLLEVPPAADCPDAVFVEDAVVVYGSVAVVTRPGALSRQPEVVDVEKTVESLGMAIARIEAPATLDGGDVLKIDNTVYVGQGGRTNDEGIRQLRRILTPLGATVVAVPVRKVLHLKSAVTALPDGTVIGYPPLVDDVSMFPRFLPVPEESGSHVVDLGGGKLLIAADCPASVELIESLGYSTVAVDISEYQKLEGCVTCLSVRVRHFVP